MLIALLAVLGVNLGVIIFLVAVLLTRRVWVSQQPDAFRGAIRVADGQVRGLRPKWKRGFGRWVGEVLVWTKAPSLFRNELVDARRMAAEVRDAAPGDKVRRLGSGPVVVAVGAEGTRIEIATAAAHQDRAVGPFGDRRPKPAGRHHSPATDDSRTPDSSPT